MEPLNLHELAEHSLLLLDTAPIIYYLEANPQFGPRFRPLFERHATGSLRFAVTTITVAEVLTGPLQAADESLAHRYRAVLESWQCVELDMGIAERAARLRASLRL